MALSRFQTIDGTEALFYSREPKFQKVFEREDGNIRLSIWFDDFSFFPLVERLDKAGRAVKGKLLRENVRLVKAIQFAEGWMLDNL